MTKEQEQKYREKKLDILLNEYYNRASERSFSVGIINRLEKEKDGLQIQFELAESELNNTDKTKTTTIKKRPKLSEDEKKAISIARQKVDGVGFKINALKGRLSKLYSDVVEKGREMKAIQKNIESITALDLSNEEQLNYIEINGTKYLAEDNYIVLDDSGNMILYLQSNVPTDSTEKIA